MVKGMAVSGYTTMPRKGRMGSSSGILSFALFGWLCLAFAGFVFFEIHVSQDRCEEKPIKLLLFFGIPAHDLGNCRVPTRSSHGQRTLAIINLNLGGARFGHAHT